MSMDDLIPILTLGIVLILLGLTAALVIDRGRIGWGRAASEAVARQRRHQDMVLRVEQMERSIAQLKAELTTGEGKATALATEIGSLRQGLDTRELPFRYTVVPTASGDMYGPSWRFVARHPSLGQGGDPDHPAAQWDAGRPYIVGSLNQSEARSIVDRLLPRHRGFTIVAVGAITGNAPQA